MCSPSDLCNVATAPTVYGIETLISFSPIFLSSSVATAPTVYGIETLSTFTLTLDFFIFVATAPTVYGIETC